MYVIKWWAELDRALTVLVASQLKSWSSVYFPFGK